MVTPKQCEGKVCPAVIWFCDASQYVDTSAAQAGFDALSRKHGFVLVVPESPTGAWGIARDDRNRVQELTLLQMMFDEITKAGVDPKRMYAVGSGSGGWTAHTVAAAMSDRIAAMAEVGASVAWLDSRWNYHGLPEPKRKISVMMMHGMLDDSVSYDMKSYTLDIPSAAAWWAKRVAGEVKPERKELADGTVVRESWKGSEAEVQLLTYMNLGHEWPGVRDIDAFDTNEAVWEFLSSRSL